MKLVYGLCVAALSLTACSTNIQLEPRPAGNPMRVALSGQWILRDGEAPAVETAQTIRMPPSASRTMQPGKRAAGDLPRSEDVSVRVFLESGANLKVTQTDFGLFFSFDRAIVEEYNFGENRIVNVGPIEARRVAGWDGSSFVIETLDTRGNILTETWRLEDDGRVLARQIGISERGEPGWSSRQVFDRE